MKFLIKLLLSIAIFGYLYNKFSKKKTLRLEKKNENK
jgi:hypothetical protein